MTELENKNGVFKSDLMRTFKQLKESRAESVSEDVEIIYKRQIEDLCHQIRIKNFFQLFLRHESLLHNTLSNGFSCFYSCFCNGLEASSCDRNRSF